MIARPPIGALLPDFTVRTDAGRTIHRRDFKGRKHLVVCFAHAAVSHGRQELVTAVAGAYPSWQAERAEALLIVPRDGAIAAPPSAPPIVPGDGAIAVPPSAPPIVADRDGRLRARFGVGAAAALFVADRYGEIVLYATGEPAVADQGLPLAEVLPTLEWLEMRCSL